MDEQRLAEAIKRPALILIAGLPGSGKSTLARFLAERANFHVVRSDLIRKELASDAGRADFEQGIYAKQWTERTYAELLKRAPAETAEQRLLVSAGIISLYQRAGRRPGKTSLAGTQSASPLPAAPEDQIPPCSLRAASQLHRVLEIGLDDVLRDWCRAAGAARVRAPDELLPALLNLVAARKDEELVCKDLVMKVMEKKERRISGIRVNIKRG